MNLLELSVFGYWLGVLTWLFSIVPEDADIAKKLGINSFGKEVAIGLSYFSMIQWPCQRIGVFHSEMAILDVGRAAASMA